MRKIVLRVKDCHNSKPGNSELIAEVGGLAREQVVRFDGMLISVGSGIAYLYADVRGPVEMMAA